MSKVSTSIDRLPPIGAEKDRLVALVARASGNARFAVLATELAALGYTVDERRGRAAVNFCERYCRHTKGDWYGVLFRLVPWEFVATFCFFGVVDPQGRRLFRRLWLEVAKKNGKTELIAAWLLLCLFALGEYGAEVYSAASAREQAAQTYRVMASMVRQEKILRRQAKLYDSVKRIYVPETESFYQALSSDANYNDGVNPFAVGVDEVHRHKDRGLWDVLAQGQGTRAEPLFFGITTAGHGHEGLAWSQHEHARMVNERTVTDPRMLSMIYSVPEEADWRDETLWHLANPSLDDFLRRDDLREAIEKAAHTPSEEHNVRRLRLNQWVAAETKWLDLLAWEKCGGLVDDIALKGAPFYGGIDISHSRDFTAWVKFFPESLESNILRGKVTADFWMPEMALETHRQMMRPDIEAWARAGFITFCPGDRVDLRMLRDKVLENCRRYEVREIGFDRYHAHGVIDDLAEVVGADVMVDMSQGYLGMNAPAKELEDMISTDRLNHGGNPVLRWMAGNAVAEVDRDDHIRPSRLKSSDKIDGIMALCTALERAIANREDDSVPGIEVIEL